MVVKSSMGALIRRTIRIIKFNFRNILLFELLYRMITTIASWEIMSSGLEFALKKAGYSYLTSKNIGSFLLRPHSLLILIGLIIMEAFFLGIEIAALLTAYQASLNQEKVHPVKMFTIGITKFFSSLKGKNKRILLMILRMSFFMNLFMIYRVLSRVRPVNYLLSGILKEPVICLSLSGAIIVLLTLYVIPGLFVPGVCYMEKLSWHEAVKKSRDIVKGRYFPILIVIVGVNILIALCFVLMYLLFAVGTGVTVVLSAAPNLRSAIMHMACDRIEILLLYIFGMVSIVVNHGIITAIYCGHAKIPYAEEDFTHLLPVTKKLSKKMKTGIVLIMFVGCYLYIFKVVRDGTLLATKAILNTQITAHRGSSYFVPENTIIAIEKAMEEMADFAEIDIQETKDGVLVLLHDASLKRTTGVDEKIWNITYEEVANLKAGVQFGLRYEDARVPALEEVLILCKGKLNLNIELKSYGYTADLPEKVVELIHQYDFSQQCVITSSNLSFLRKVKELAPEIKTGYILSAAYGKYYEETSVDFISIRSSFVTENMVEVIQGSGKEVHAWTVNSQSELERMKLLGVDNIITDRPLYAREIIFKEKAAESLLEYIKSALR